MINVKWGIISGIAAFVLQKTFDSFTPKEREVFMAGSEIAKNNFRNLMDEGQWKLVDDFKNKFGVTVTEIDVNVWRPYVADIWAKYKDKISPKYFDAFTK